MHLLGMFSSMLSTIGSCTIIYFVYKRSYGVCHEGSHDRRRTRRRGHNNGSSSNNNKDDHQEQPQQRRRRHFKFEIYHFLVGMLSVGDLLSSVSMFVSPFMVPTYVPEKYWALGNLQTCAISGFFLYFTSCMIAAMNFLLALYFFTTIRNNKKYKRARR